MKSNRFLSTPTIIVLSIVLFYLPSILFQVEKGDRILSRDFIGILMSTFYTVAFCVNYYWLVPKMLLRRSRLPLYLAVNLCMVVVAMLFGPIWMELHGGIPHPPGKHGEDISLLQHFAMSAALSIRDGLMMILASTLGFAIRFGKEKEFIRTRELELNAEQRQIELLSLKAQLNPHFLFNSLNNIYALIGFAPDRAQEALHSLSRMLRFMIYDSSESVDLDKEANFIGEYVELMRLRMKNGGKLHYTLSPNLPVNVKIAPMLYVTLVENAFKHSASNGNDYYIHISLFSTVPGEGRARKEKLVFEVENTYSEEEAANRKEDQNNDRIGVGLKNVGRQLNLLYPDANNFEISASEGVYRASIMIDIDALKQQ